MTQPKLVRRVGLFDATMLVMGGIVGAGIFLKPAEVARHVQAPGPIVGVWLIGGALRERYDTSIVPGRFFGLADHFRIGIGGPTAIFEAGLDRLGAALDALS